MHPIAPTVAETPAHGAGLRVLVLDDDQFDRQRLCRMVTKLPVAVVPDTAATLEEFRHRLTERPYDLVFVDYALADGTGIDALRIFAASPSSERAECIVVSGEQRADIAAACFRDGCRDYITKAELSPQALLRALAHVAGLARQTSFPDVSEIAQQLRSLLRDDLRDALRAALDGPANPAGLSWAAALLSEVDEFVFANLPDDHGGPSTH